MARSLSWIDGSAWPGDDGWPYPDADGVPADASPEPDDDLVALHALSGHLFDGLGPLERAVVLARFGLDGPPARTMKQLQAELGLPRAELREALGEALTKLRAHLA